MSEFKSQRGLGRVIPAWRYAISGLITASRIEHAFRQELFLSAFATVVAFMLPVSAMQKLVLIGVWVLVLIVELLNSAIEATVDRISLERHPLSKNAKDFGGAAVFLSIALATTTWGTILWPLLF
jgi:diacylglycerol kinase (ATP)